MQAFAPTAALPARHPTYTQDSPRATSAPGTQAESSAAANSRCQELKSYATRYSALLGVIEFASADPPKQRAQAARLRRPEASEPHGDRRVRLRLSESSLPLALIRNQGRRFARDLLRTNISAQYVWQRGALQLSRELICCLAESCFVDSSMQSSSSSSISNNGTMWERSMQPPMGSEPSCWNGRSILRTQVWLVCRCEHAL